MGLLNNVHAFFASSVTELSLIMLIAAKLSFCVGAFCVLTVWGARLYKTHRFLLAVRENTDCADWVEELYILGSWIDVIKICLRFVRYPSRFKVGTSAKFLFSSALKIASILSSLTACLRTSQAAVCKTKQLFRSAIWRLWWGDDLFIALHQSQ